MAVMCMAAAQALKVRGLHGADEAEPGTRPSPCFPTVPLNRRGHLRYFSLPLCLMVDPPALLGWSDTMSKRYESCRHM